MAAIKSLIYDKRFRYLIYSLFVSVGVLIMSTQIILESTLFLIVAICLFLATLLLLVIRRSPVFRAMGYVDLGFYLVLPIHLIIGFLVAFFYFPNIGLLIRVVAFLGFFSLIYITFLINNIFTVIKEREEVIPLYTVAITWIQILIIMISIPYLSGIYKISTNFLIQNLVVFTSSFLFNYYLIWSASFDTDTRRLIISEKVLLAAIFAFLVFVSGVGVSFFPTESFLRAIFVSTVQMLGIVYIYSYLKNKLNLRILFQYIIISIIFFIILIFFRPQ